MVKMTVVLEDVVVEERVDLVVNMDVVVPEISP